FRRGGQGSIVVNQRDLAIDHHMLVIGQLDDEIRLARVTLLVFEARLRFVMVALDETRKLQRFLELNFAPVASCFFVALQRQSQGIRLSTHLPATFQPPASLAPQSGTALGGLVMSVVDPLFETGAPRWKGPQQGIQRALAGLSKRLALLF